MSQNYEEILNCHDINQNSFKLSPICVYIYMSQIQIIAISEAIQQVHHNNKASRL